jgi:hypothetical protein
MKGHREEIYKQMSKHPQSALPLTSNNVTICLSKTGVSIANMQAGPCEMSHTHL